MALESFADVAPMSAGGSLSMVSSIWTISVVLFGVVRSTFSCQVDSIWSMLRLRSWLDRPALHV